MGWFNHQPENTYHLSRMQSFPLQILRAESALKLKMDDEKVRFFLMIFSGRVFFSAVSKGKVGYLRESTYQHIPPIYGLYTGCIGEFFPLTVVFVS